MYIYVLMVILVLIAMPKYKIKFMNNENKFYILWITLFLIAILRGNGNGDYFTYKNYATYINNIQDIFNSNFPMEIGFRCIAYLVNLIKLDLQWVLIIMNIISMGIMYKFIKRYSPDYTFTLLLFIPFYFQFEIQASRMAIALSIICLAIKYIDQSKIVKYICMVLLAMCFHKSAIIAIMMYPLSKIKIEINIKIAILIFISIFTFIFSVDNLIINLLDILNMDSMSNKYQRYIYSKEYGHQFKLYDPRIVLALMTLFFIELADYNKKNIDNIFKMCAFFNICLMIILREHTIFVIRLSAYYNIFSIISIPIAYEIFRRNAIYKSISEVKMCILTKLAIVIIYLCHIFYLIITFMYPYKFYKW